MIRIVRKTIGHPVTSKVSAKCPPFIEMLHGHVDQISPMPSSTSADKIHQCHQVPHRAILDEVHEHQCHYHPYKNHAGS